jgi:hypothetical protein
MNVPETYDYLVRPRRDLWSTLVSVPDEVLSRPLLNGSRLHCIKDLVAHVPDRRGLLASRGASHSKRCWTTGALSRSAPSRTSAR